MAHHTPEQIAKLARRTEIGNELRKINSRLTEISEEFRAHKRFTPAYYQQLVAEQGSIKRKKLALEGEVTSIKQWLRENDKHPKTIRVLGGIDETDLRNALIEPQTLLRQAYAAMKRLTRNVGTSDGDRALLDAMEDYLRRRAILI